MREQLFMDRRRTLETVESVLWLVASSAIVISATGTHCRCIKTAVVQEGTIKRRSGLRGGRALPSAFHPSFPVPCAQGERRREGGERDLGPSTRNCAAGVCSWYKSSSLGQQPKTRLIPFSFKREPERESEPPFATLCSSPPSSGPNIAHRTDISSFSRVPN